MWSIEQLYIELGKKYDLGCSHYKNKRTLFNDLIFSDGFGGGDENVVKKKSGTKRVNTLCISSSG